MPARDDRDSLLGLIAVRNHFVTQAALLDSLDRAAESSRTVLEILRDDHGLDDASIDCLETLAARHLGRFGGDAAMSIEAIATVGAGDSSGTVVVDDEYATRSPDADDRAVWAEPVVIPSAARFRVVRLHAKGGLGQVSVAIDRELGREVAFKEIQDHRADHGDSRARFRLEAEITGGLEHPGIVPVYSLGQDATGRPYYAMRFIRGDDLQAAITRFHADDAGREPSDRSSALRKLLTRFIDVCDAVGYAHSRGVLHRDLKPGNIMLGEYGETLVVDWGLAKLVGAPEVGGGEPLRPASGTGSTETQGGAAVGTPAFMSPEQARGELDRLGPASDVYSLGATLYALLAGNAPYEGPAVDVIQRVPTGDFPRPRRVDPRVPRPLEAVCLKAMSLNPADRYPTARALAEDVEHWLADEPVSAYRETISAKVARWARRHKSATLSGAAALLAVAAMATFALIVVHRALAAQTRATIAADRDRSRAEARESMAVDAVKKFEQAVIDNPQIRDDPRLKPLRVALLKEPLEFSRSLRAALLADDDPRPESLAKLAAVAHSLAGTTSAIGDKEDALKALGESLAILERLVRDDPKRSEFRRELARGLDQLGSLQFETGRADLAGASYESSRSIRRDLVDENPRDADALDELAASINNIGILQRETRDAGEALKSYGRALEIRQALVRENPQSIPYLNALAGLHQNIGNIERDTGRSEAALASYRRALEIDERLSHENDHEPKYKNNVADGLNNLGNLQVGLDRQTDALASYTQAIEIREELVRENPSVTQYRGNLVKSLLNLGVQFSRMGRPDKAEATLTRGAEIGEALVEENPSVTSFRGDLAGTYTEIAILQGDRGRWDLAEATHARAIKLRERLAHDNPTQRIHQTYLANGYVNLGVLQNRTGRRDPAIESHDRARVIFERLGREDPSMTIYREGAAMCHYNIACVLALKSAATNAEPAAAAALADRAIASLKAAEAAGWTNWKGAAEDSDFKSLRGRADFQSLVVRKPKPAGAK